MKIEITNRLPNGCTAEIFIDQNRTFEMVREDGIESLVQPFLEQLHREMQTNQSGWLRWEGYWRTLENGNKNLSTLGALYYQGRICLRGFRVRNVPSTLEETVKDGLFIMIQEYLDKLKEQLKIHNKMTEGNGKIHTGWGDGKSSHTCSICARPFRGMGNNAEPVNNGRCCDACNAQVVIPARLERMQQGKNPYGDPQIDQ